MKRLTKHTNSAAIAAVTGTAMISLALTSTRDARTGAHADAAEVQVTAAAVAAGGAASSLFTGAGLGPEWDLPNVEHERIDFWVARFDTVPDMREKFQGFLDRGGEFAPMIIERLDARGMPRDLLYLAMIESGFQTNATSHAAAVGVWQFIPASGKRFGLAIDRAVDERRIRSARRRQRSTIWSSCIAASAPGTSRPRHTTPVRDASVGSCGRSSAG